jgi:hypothetical protein
VVPARCTLKQSSGYSTKMVPHTSLLPPAAALLLPHCLLLLRSYYPTASCCCAHTTARIVDADENHDMALSFDEFESIATRTALLRIAYIRADGNGDGTVSRDELIESLRQDDELCALLGLPGECAPSSE